MDSTFMQEYLKTIYYHILPSITVLLFQEFSGNSDEDSVVYHQLNLPIRARYIRFRPKVWNNSVSMRVELYGCRGGKRSLFLLSIMY